MSAGPTKEYPAKVTAYVVISCLVAASGGLIFGYDIGISGKLCVEVNFFPISSLLGGWLLVGVGIVRVVESSYSCERGGCELVKAGN